MFLSIRWKIILIAGVVLAGMAALFSWQQHLALSQQFERDQLAYRERLQDMATRLFQLQNDRLQVLGRMLVETPSLRAALKAGDAAALNRAMEPIWSELNLGQGLTGLVLFDPQQQVLGQWGEVSLPRLSGLAKLSNLRETPQTWVECGAACMHQVVLPVGELGRSLGSIAMVAGMEGWILDLHRLANAEVAILAGGASQGTAVQGANPLAGMRLLSISGGEGAHALLRQALSRPWHGGSFETQDTRATWSVLALSPDLPGDGLMRVALITDITRARQAIRQGLWRNLEWGAVVLLFSMLTLFILQRPTMGRIQRVSALLPLLGKGRFQEVIDAVPGPVRTHFPDEMHGLERLAIELAHQLLALHDADAAHAAALTTQAAQLEQERDFVTGLLDTAPVLIVTYGLDGRIRMVNAFAVVDCSLGRDRLIGRSYAAFFLNEKQRTQHQELLKDMRPGDVTRGEGAFTRDDGQRREVVWFHSCLDDVHGERLFLSVGLDVTEHRLAEQRLLLLVEHDAVTGLLNRRTFKRELDTLMSKGGQGLVLVCDLDEFRALNDADGHEAGDRVLMLFAQHIQHLDPVPALSARLGSDEFALAFPDLGTADAILLARHLSRVVSLQAVGENGAALKRHLSACVGLAAFPQHGASADALLGNAELALAHARAKGHGSWHLYSVDETYRERADRRAYWRDEVEQALDEDRFVLHFQPIVHIASSQVSHYEALLRMVDREGNLVPPGLFIDVAESTGLIRRIDRWVVQAAVAAAAAHREAKIALNLSSRSFDDDMAYETMQAAMQHHHVAGERMLLEITETAALANFTGAKRIMDKFQSLGCVFGLDDFGVGYSSFQYLRELPVGFVKIDGSFIKNLTKNPDDVVFVRALNGAVQGFGKTTVAEFVEDGETLNILREIGVDHAQGYLIGKPGPDMSY